LEWVPSQNPPARWGIVIRQLVYAVGSVIVCPILLGCDGGVIVRGQIAGRSDSEKACEVSLWNRRAPLWKRAEPHSEKTAMVNGNSLDLGRTIGGPTSAHWIEIACPGHEIYRTKEFEAPTVNRVQNLGTVELKKTGAGK
jgi:hypothetical protein